MGGCSSFVQMFSDVPDGPHREAIACLTLLGIVQGRDPDHFDPTSPVRRDQAAALLARALTKLGKPLPVNPPDAFADDDGNQFESSINALAALGVVRGTVDNSFRPAATITRGQAASLLVRLWDAAGQPGLRSLGDAFSDDDGNVHEAAINQLAAAAIVVGGADSLYRPDDPIRRDQFASLLARLYYRITGG
jgi:hypothetical protein